MSMSFRKRDCHFQFFLSVQAACLSISCGCSLFVDTIPSGIATQTRLKAIERRLDHYYELHSQIPLSIDSLSTLPDYDDKNQDEWGRDFRWDLKEDGSVLVVTSLGRDGAAGGSGDNSDLELYYVPMPTLK